MTADETLAGKLLVASPALTDPNFKRTVVFIIRHDEEEGAFGLILNRPLSHASVAEHLPGWAELSAPPPLIFSGGPVEPAVALALGRFPENAIDPGDAALPGVAIVNLAADEPAPTLETVRVFSGYAGWSPGQLEQEVDESAWFIVDAFAADIFSQEPGDLWRDVLKRQPGALATFAYFPSDPRQN